LFDEKTQREIGTSAAVAAAAAEQESQHKQHRQMLVALGLLLVALLVVVVKDRDFWLGSAPESSQDSAEEAQPPTAAPVQSTGGEKASSPHTTKSKSHTPPRIEHAPISQASPAVPPVNGATITASNRAALPPLEVEVVAGGQHTVLQSTNRSVKVDLQSGTPGTSVPGAMDESKMPSSATAPPTVATNAGERVRLSPDTAQMVERPVQPNYPMLAKQMKVQGSVVLQALIGQEGSIQDLRVLSGPAILSTAAMDAVRQWRFRPYLQSGQAVETEARITVNFTISTN
jgi:protein TonB